MAFVITMGGLSKRFLEAGYNTPKYALPLGNKTLFEFAVSSFKNYFKTDLFIFVVKSDGFAPEFVRKKIANLGIKSYDIVESLQEDTSDGQNHFSLDWKIIVMIFQYMFLILIPFDTILKSQV